MIELSPLQQQAYAAIKAFLQDKDSQVFILKGYAGTGKTTMIKQLIPAAEAAGRAPLLLAPTGRAAKVLGEKTGCPAQTIHSAIYGRGMLEAKRYDEQGSLIVEKKVGKELVDDMGVDQIKYYFGVKQLEVASGAGGVVTDPGRWVIIVDEASLVSSKESRDEVFHFGSGVLLDDLLTCSSLHKGAKIVFVGDPAQLPPVGDAQSMALSESYFKEKGLKVACFELTEVLRQAGDSVILGNAMKVRDLLLEEHRNTLAFDLKDGEFEAIGCEAVVEKVYEAQPRPEFDDHMIVCFSNAQAKEYNDRLRQLYFPDCMGVQEGDVLMVVQNNYNLISDGGEPCCIYNGDFIKVLKVAPQRDEQTSPVWVSEHGERKRVQVKLSFRDIEFMAMDGKCFKCKMLENLLESDKASILPEQRMALYVLFRMRHPEIDKDKAAMMDALMYDPYFNALMVKYGYAVTAHKAQGGEWDTVYVDYAGRRGLCDDHLRWNYTATTRARTCLYGVNIPYAAPFSGFSIGNVTLVSKAPKGGVALADVDKPTLLPAQAGNFRKWKYATFEQGLKELGCSILRVDTLQYMDRYHIATPEGTEVVDCYYTDAAVFSRYLPQNTGTYYASKFLELLADEGGYQYSYEYAPSRPSLEGLFRRVVSACDELGIRITNIQEFPERYYVLYSFKTSGKFSMIQFYFKANGGISRALPSSDMGAGDALLNLLIENLR